MSNLRVWGPKEEEKEDKDIKYVDQFYSTVDCMEYLTKKAIEYFEQIKYEEFELDGFEGLSEMNSYRQL